MCVYKEFSCKTSFGKFYITFHRFKICREFIRISFAVKLRVKCFKCCSNYMESLCLTNALDCSSTITNVIAFASNF